MKLNFQKIRHSNIARVLRKLIFKTLTKSQKYPLKYVAYGLGKKNDAPTTSKNIYIHLPFCQAICPHCPYNKSLFKEALYNDYARALKKEISHWLSTYPQQKIETLYFGGGTPTLTPKLVEDVIDLFKPRLENNAEVGIECHPSNATKTLLKDLKKMGVNMISLGVETFKDSMLKNLGRHYSAEDAQKAIENARSVGFRCVDINLIYGAPGQSLEDTQRDVEKAIALGVDHISAYPLFTFQGTPFGKRVEKNRFGQINDRDRLKAQKLISKIVLKNGYKRTSVWSYTKDNAPPYTTVTRESYIGFGAGAGSKVGGVFWFNTFSIKEYNGKSPAAQAIILETDQALERFHWLYWKLYNVHIDPIEFEKLHGKNIHTEFFLIFVLLWGLRLAKKNPDKTWTLTERGAIWVHRIQMLFSITYIDKVWTTCQKTPWPQEIILE